MAKPTVTRFFTDGFQVSGAELFRWTRVPPVNMLGFGGGWTVDRVRLFYHASMEPATDSNGDVRNALAITLAVTTGNPPVAPAFQPLDPSPGDEVIYREIALAHDRGASTTLYSPAKGEVDAKSKRSIPPAPESAALWFGIQRFDEAGPVGGVAYRVLVLGVLIQLRGAP